MGHVSSCKIFGGAVTAKPCNLGDTEIGLRKQFLSLFHPQILGVLHDRGAGGFAEGFRKGSYRAITVCRNIGKAEVGTEVPMKIGKSLTCYGVFGGGRRNTLKSQQNHGTKRSCQRFQLFGIRRGGDEVFLAEFFQRLGAERIFGGGVKHFFVGAAELSHADETEYGLFLTDRKNIFADSRVAGAEKRFVAVFSDTCIDFLLMTDTDIPHFRNGFNIYATGCRMNGNLRKAANETFQAFVPRMDGHVQSVFRFQKGNPFHGLSGNVHFFSLFAELCRNFTELYRHCEIIVCYNAKKVKGDFAMYYEKSREIAEERCDVLVIGSGPAGIAAALSAARLGRKTVIVEQLGTLGGISTSGMMSHWTGSCDSRLYREILTESARRNGDETKPQKYIDPEMLKIQYLDMLSAENVKILLYTLASEPISVDDRVKGVIVENKEGRLAVFADTVIDASGDGDIAAKAGVPYTKGRETDGKMQPATLMFKVGGVDTARAAYLPSFETKYQTERGELQALAKEHLPYPAGHVLLYPSTLPGVVTCNMTNAIDIDGTKNADLVRAEHLCRGQIGKIVAFLREFVPGYETCYLLSTASLIGIRETRHFEGMYTLTEQDILDAREFPDWIVKGAKFNFDVHNITGAGLDKTGVQHKFPQKNGYTIPLGCFIPKHVRGLLLCGRNISGTHMAHSNFRVMPICVGMGEGCGAVAAYAGKHGLDYADVNLGVIQSYLNDGIRF